MHRKKFIEFAQLLDFVSFIGPICINVGLHKNIPQFTIIVCCPILFREMSRIDITARSAYPGGSIALVISGRAIIDGIYCHFSDQEVYHYLNLHGDYQAFSDRPYMKGSR